MPLRLTWSFCVKVGGPCWYGTIFLQAIKSMESFFGNMTNFIDQYGSSEMTRNSVLIDLQYIFIMCVCITGVPEKGSTLLTHYLWLILALSQSAGSSYQLRQAWDKTNFVSIWNYLNDLESPCTKNLFRNIRKQGCPLNCEQHSTIL